MARRFFSLMTGTNPSAPKPYLLKTLFRGTVTHEAFLGYSHSENYEGRALDQEAFRLGLVAQIDWRHDASIIGAIEHLKHDEHIDAATSSNTIGNAFCIAIWASQASGATSSSNTKGS